MPRNRKIFTGRTIRDWSGGELSFPKPDIRLQKLVAARINQGMITAIDSADIPPESLQLAKNAKVVFDKTSRRDGLTAFGPTPPNIEPVLKMVSIKNPDGSGHTYRFTPSTIHDLQGGVWNPIAETLPLSSLVTDRFKVANVFDIIAFTNNGANNIQWIDSSTDISDDLIDNLSADLGSSKFRFCTGFFNRIVMAAIREENEILLAWSGEFGSQGTTKRGLEDLDPLVNETSGFTPLIDSPSDTSDFIKGIFGISSVMIILREKSIWVVTKQPSAINPFNAYAAIPGIGCDSPHSAKITNYGIAWLDRRTRTVYHFTPGSTPEPIGRPIERTLINNITDPDLLFGSYDPIEDSYSVCIPSIGSPVVQVWTFYFRDKAWTYNEYVNMTSFDDTELLTGYIAIDDLVGTMNQLEPTFDNLSPVVKSKSQRIFGFSDGTLAIPDSTADEDVGEPFMTDLISKAFDMPSTECYVAMVLIEFVAQIVGAIEFWYAPDGGVDPDKSFIFGESFASNIIGEPQIIAFKRVVHSRRYAFAIRANSGQFELLRYEVWVTPTGDIKMDHQSHTAFFVPFPFSS